MNQKRKNKKKSNEDFDNYKFSYVETYRGKRIYTNNYCHAVSLNKKKRYFYSDGKPENQILRCRKEVDMFLAGEIK